VTVRASDGSLTDDQAISVTVTNENDNAPVITSNGGGDIAGVSVAENSSVVTTVTATDADGDIVTFSITGGADAVKFAINANTGALTFVAAPDYESPTDSGANNVYDVEVTASDGTHVDTQAIAVTVTNVNDNPPVITSNGGGDSAGVSVAENATAVTTVAATDADSDTLTYSITGGADALKFSIDATTGALTFAALMGAGGGVVTVVFFAAWAAAFGRAHLGKIQGAAQVLTVLASALGPVLLALGQRHGGSYSATFLALAPILLLLALACWLVPMPQAAGAKPVLTR